MSVIEDGRKVIQDFLAPELRAISVRLDALEKRMDGLDHKIDEVDRRAEKRHDQVMGALRDVVEWSSVQQRLAKFDSKDRAH